MQLKFLYQISNVLLIAIVIRHILCKAKKDHSKDKDPETIMRKKLSRMNKKGFIKKNLAHFENLANKYENGQRVRQNAPNKELQEFQDDILYLQSEKDMRKHRKAIVKAMKEGIEDAKRQKQDDGSGKKDKDGKTVKFAESAKAGDDSDKDDDGNADGDANDAQSNQVGDAQGSQAGDVGDGAGNKSADDGADGNGSNGNDDGDTQNQGGIMNQAQDQGKKAIQKMTGQDDATDNDDKKSTDALGDANKTGDDNKTDDIKAKDCKKNGVAAKDVANKKNGKAAKDQANKKKGTATKTPFYKSKIFIGVMFLVLIIAMGAGIFALYKKMRQSN